MLFPLLLPPTMSIFIFHLEARAGWGFETIECGRNTSAFSASVRGGCVLFDSVTALLANEMFPPPAQNADFSVDFAAGERVAAELSKIANPTRLALQGGAQCAFRLPNRKVPSLPNSTQGRSRAPQASLQCAEPPPPPAQNADFSVDFAAGERVAAELSKIANAAMHFVCVCDDIFRDGMQYDAVTESYRRALAFVCRQLASEFDIVVEASSGITRTIKGNALFLRDVPTAEQHTVTVCFFLFYCYEVVYLRFFYWHGACFLQSPVPSGAGMKLHAAECSAFCRSSGLLSAQFGLRPLTFARLSIYPLPFAH